jgi:D-glycero-D-manno-heptose 1,7-bisphosphate phosphatase
MRKAVFLDRDGVLNVSLVRDGKPYAPRTAAEFQIYPDVVQLVRLRALGYLLVVATNQPDIANGLVSRDFVDGLHARLNETLPFDAILTCPHASGEGCDCRKPKAGMLYQAQAQFGIDLAGSFMVGDRWRDILAGSTAGCKTVFIDHGYAEDAPPFHPDFTCTSLGDAIAWIEKNSGL